MTAMKSGVRRLDTTLGGIGDCVATEDALHLLETLEVTVLADRGAVVRAAVALETALGELLPGRTYRLQTTLTSLTPSNPSNPLGPPTVLGAPQSPDLHTTLTNGS